MFGLFKRKKKTHAEEESPAEQPVQQDETPAESDRPAPEETAETASAAQAGAVAEEQPASAPHAEPAPLEPTEPPTPATVPIETHALAERPDTPATAAEETTASSAEPVREKPRGGFFARLRERLSKTRRGLADALGSLIAGRKQIDDELLEEIEMILLSADVGIDATDRIIQALTKQVSCRELKDPEALLNALRQQLLDILKPVAQPLEIPASDKPFVILMVGVNGVGKTTTIGKLAKKLQADGKKVMLAAGDTFRAAAVEQLQTWGERNNVPVIAQQTGADSAAVIFDALQAAQARGMDVLIADTAGRLHTQSNLMEELKKVKRVMAKLDERAPHEVMLVIDASTGQNAMNQTKIFNDAVGLTGLTLTKLDGTAKGGIVIALADKFGIPIRYIGVGEGIDDLQPFDAEAFVAALFDRETASDQ
ncbi:signal recognition particle-docking protein FtsY [Sulfurivirga caldicuralii]|uniref:Signal recognition particle receptor FtsY n=1 Tax=Sulfurivirga caldicuralii TaxID=364032 RepID=A0A1N6GXJ1_9GAMM|nr:signal recognition particle-docking protein FtsY [Sulfurivirga caldicuralii]SIO12216.1 signal recognition particle-docking protein FtsY [Sulfurivirga caldicuralii]